MSTDFKCNDGNEHDFDSNTESEYCAKGCGEKWAIYAIKKLGADLKEKDAALEQLKAHLDKVNSEYYEMKIAYKESLDKSRDEIKKIHSENETLRDNLAWWQCNPCESLKDQIQQLKSKLEIAKKGLEKIKELSCSCGFSAINGKMQEYKCIACEALKEIGEG